MNEEAEDIASNPLAEGHLPVSGEVSSRDGVIEPDISNDADPLVDEYA